VVVERFGKWREQTQAIVKVSIIIANCVGRVNTGVCAARALNSRVVQVKGPSARALLSGYV
jgi:hypothetical protein